MFALKLVLYLASFLTCLACTVLLIRRRRQDHTPLLLWSALCFVGLSVNSAIAIVDAFIVPSIDLRIPRLATSLIAMAFLLYGFIWEVRR